MTKTIKVYPLAWLKLSKIFAQCGALGLPLNSWHEDIQSVFRAMAEEGILTIKEPEGFVHLAKRLPKGFKEQVKRYA